MAPKRSAPPPPVIADSPPSATARPKNVAAPPHKKDGEVNKATSPSTTNIPLLPPPKLEPDEDGEVNKATSPSTIPPPPPDLEESESEGEEADDKAPESNPAPKQQAEGKGGKPPASSKGKKPALPIIPVWSKEDAVRILKALAAHRREHGKLLQPDELEAALTGTLDRRYYGPEDLQVKVKNLKSFYTRQVEKGQPPSKKKDRLVYDLAKEVWGSSDTPANPRDFGEMCELYPFLGQQMKGVEKMYPGLFKRQFGMISDEKASALDAKVKKLRWTQFKLDQELIKVLTDLMDK